MRAMMEHGKKKGTYIEKCGTHLEDTVKEQYLNITVLLWRQ
jgi:hypothetical protein